MLKRVALAFCETTNGFWCVPSPLRAIHPRAERDLFKGTNLVRHTLCRRWGLIFKETIDEQNNLAW
jgi:hypothetical protein